MSNTLPATAYPTGLSHRSDQDQLIARCLAGEEDAYLAVYNHYAATIYRLCYSFLIDKEDAEEVLQDTFEYAFRKLDRYNARKSSFKTWLYQIALCRCRNKRRRKWLPTFPISHLNGPQAADDASPNPAEVIALNERQCLILNALKSLSPKLRETAILRYYEGLTFTEIGQVLSISPKTAESRMRLAHKSLRGILEEELDLGGSK